MIIKTKILLILIFAFSFLFTTPLRAENRTNNNEVIFSAKVVEILAEKNNVLPDGKKVLQQDIKLKGLSGKYKDKEVQFNGIGNYDVINKHIYRVGDTVMVVASKDYEGNTYYYINDYVRTTSMLWLVVIFVLVLVVVGGIKGLRSILALVVSFVVIVKYVIPQILVGGNPITVTIIGSFAILLAIIYITEGFSSLSHLAVFSIFVSLLFTILISWIFVGLAKLSGIANEETSFLLVLGDNAINFKGLLLAGIIIGALGVLDDVVISQISTVKEIFKASSSLNRKEIFLGAYRVGVSHIASMTNTLFLAYAGVSLPLLILFVSGKSAFTSWLQIVNNEAIATEIIRALAGSVGLVLSVPITTFIAVWWYHGHRPSKARDKNYLL